MMFSRKSKSPAARRTRPLILVIDDEVDLCRCLSLSIDPEQFEVLSAHDGQSGLAMIRELRPELVMLDIKMPVMNGYQVLAEIHTDPELAQIPIVIMTSLAEEGQFSDEEWARRLGVAHFISKPFDPGQAAAEVTALLQPR